MYPRSATSCAVSSRKRSKPSAPLRATPTALGSGDPGGCRLGHLVRVRGFLEDNRLIEPPVISGPGERLQRARDEHEVFFRTKPTLNDRDYLLGVFDGLSSYPATKEVFGSHNPIRDVPQWLSGDAAGLLIAFFQRIDANSGALVHDFLDPDWDTRFLGDLYQDLSEAARKKYALLQTPVFVEEFILDRTLDPAIEEFGLSKVGYENRLLADGRLAEGDRFRMIDPACGSGHFLLGSFARLLERWRRKEPGTKVAVLVQLAFDSVHGVDLNPYAVAIARFRLLLAAMKECGVVRLKDAPGFEIHLACGDSLLHGNARKIQQMFDAADELKHVYQPEDPEALTRLLQPGSYQAVVANPPYITPKDAALNAAYRERYATCHRQYANGAVSRADRHLGGRRWLYRSDHGEQFHEGRVREEVDRRVPSSAQPYTRYRY